MTRGCRGQGYGFRHNCGRGDKHLAMVFANLMMLAFLIDQVRRRSCRLFQAKAERPSCFWEKAGSRLPTSVPRDWETLCGAIAFGVRPGEPEPPDTS